MRLLLISTYFFLAANCLNPPSSSDEGELLESLLGETSGYNPGVKPPGTTNVSVNMYVRSFLDVNHMDMTMKLQVTFRQKWFDPRLKYDSALLKHISVPSMSQVWHPDTFFRNGLEATIHKDIDENFYVRVFPNGDVLQSVRMTVTLACPMYLGAYPFDVQTCPLMLASYSNFKEDIDYNWKGEDPIQMAQSLSLPSYTLMAFKSNTCDVLTSTGAYSCLKVDFTLSRSSSNEVLTIMIPIAMFTVISWLALFIKRDQMTTRTILILISLVCISFKAHEVNSRLPPVSYTKVIDYYTGINVFLVFCTLLHVILVNCLQKSIQEKQAQGLGLIAGIREAPWSVKLDRIGRIIFPVIYLLFSLIFTVSVYSMKSQCGDLMADDPNTSVLKPC